MSIVARSTRQRLPSSARRDPVEAVAQRRSAARRVAHVLAIAGMAAFSLPSHVLCQLSQHPVDSIPTVPPTFDSTGVRGTVLVYALRAGRLLATHPSMVDERRIPASTFKIANALIALEKGTIHDEQSVLPWDSVVRPRVELNRDLDLATAFRISAVPHFQHLARSVGMTEMHRYLRLFEYGNQDTSGGVDRFWLSGGLRISPREQIAFLVRLYLEDLPLQSVTMQTVRHIMKVEDDAGITIRGKTGWALLQGGGGVGWWVGWVQTESGTFFFASMIEDGAPRPSFGSARIRVAREVLEGLGILRGPE